LAAGALRRVPASLRRRLPARLTRVDRALPVRLLQLGLDAAAARGARRAAARRRGAPRRRATAARARVQDHVGAALGALYGLHHSIRRRRRRRLLLRWRSRVVMPPEIHAELGAVHPAPVLRRPARGRKAAPASFRPTAYG